ncbi:WXG100 family type VII secretion target [Christensenellaceae bacterium OttesenSCG-928-M15]|nr:WXG100 family type VII secretion target [Christensenellaceae bacterium OttesenSCG-928-M15]
MSNNMLNINVAMVRKQAERLDQLSNELNAKVVKRLNGVVMNSRAAWSGDAAAFFDQYMTDSSTSLEQFAKTVRDYAERLRQIAKQAQQAQQQAKQSVST